MHLRPHLAIEPVEILKKKRLRKLTRAVGAEIEKQNRVAVANPLLVRLKQKSAAA